MSENKNVGVVLGLDLVSVLGIVFIILKLCKVIDWSWWWVLLPFWGGAAIVVALGLVALLILAFSQKN